jgi:RimJ/RimL family protein N-acetyltransferase
MLERLPHAEKPWIENYAILLRPDSENQLPNPRFIGAVGVIRFAEGSGAEVGYGIHPEYQGKGYATEALRLFVGLYWSKKSMF